MQKILRGRSEMVVLDGFDDGQMMKETSQVECGMRFGE